TGTIPPTVIQPTTASTTPVTDSTTTPTTLVVSESTTSPLATNTTLPHSSQTLPPTLSPTVTANSTLTGPPTTLAPTTTLPPQSTIVPANTTFVIPSNTTIPIVVSEPPSTTLSTSKTSSETASTASGVTSVVATATVTNSQPWLPTTIVVDPTATTVSAGLAPTSASGIPTALPKAITPDSGLDPQPEDTTLIQIGFLYGFNYNFVVGNNKAAAQIFQLLPQALSYAGGFDSSKVQMRKLIPLDTPTLGYITTLAIVTYPSSMVEALRMDVKIPSSALYNNPEQLVYNLTLQINPSIDIILGSYPDSPASPQGSGVSAPGTTSSPNSDPFNSNSQTGGDQSSTQRGTTAGIVSGAVCVAAAYGAAMFIIARRYKRKKQAHRRTSSLTNPSDMRQTPRSSPALMGGALLSRDFTSSYGGVAGGRDSHGSGRSGMGNSGRTAYISAPVAAENSLGWN
ncbi:hypothetical protein QBC46DRAFT_251217, partial [Diplogelasinospora grovesii]